MKYRLYLFLNDVENCNNWQSDGTIVKRQSINDVIIQAMRQECNNETTEDFLNAKEGGFQCPKNYKGYIMYNAHLHGTPQVNLSSLLSCMDQWINDPSTESVDVNGADLSIDKVCSGIHTIRDYECSNPNIVGSDGNSSDDNGSNKKVMITLSVFVVILSVVLIGSLIYIW